jgi:hypothetical protein
LASVLAAVSTLAAAGGLAQPAAAKTPASCRNSILGGVREQPTAQLPGTLEASVLAEYAVFARPQVASDLPPLLNTAGASLEFRLQGYYAGEIRQLIALPDGRRWLAVPGFQRTFKVPPAICLPKAVRKHRAQLVQEETQRATQPAYCIVEVGSKQGIFGGEGECTPFSEVDEQQALFGAGFGFESSSAVSIVPNGVSTVRVVYPRGLTVTLQVHENAVLLTVPTTIRSEVRKARHETDRIHFPKHPSRAQVRRLRKTLERLQRRLQAEAEAVRIEWLGPGGAAVKVIPRPKLETNQALLIV